MDSVARSERINCSVFGAVALSGFPRSTARSNCPHLEVDRLHFSGCFGPFTYRPLQSSWVLGVIAA